ncbi:hypothetical protein M0R45_006269 [Rubus argutus]|uniref:Uncharacterized protein n=1 Tax=Rubus argutus TaxID=59490 RepID=A0AAW1YQN9_RUBAR
MLSFLVVVPVKAQLTAKPCQLRREPAPPSATCKSRRQRRYPKQLLPVPSSDQPPSSPMPLPRNPRNRNPLHKPAPSFVEPRRRRRALSAALRPHISLHRRRRSHSARVLPLSPIDAARILTHSQSPPSLDRNRSQPPAPCSLSTAAANPPPTLSSPIADASLASALSCLKKSRGNNEEHE